MQEFDSYCKETLIPSYFRKLGCLVVLAAQKISPLIQSDKWGQNANELLVMHLTSLTKYKIVKLQGLCCKWHF